MGSALLPIQWEDEDEEDVQQPPFIHKEQSSSVAFYVKVCSLSTSCVCNYTYFGKFAPLSGGISPVLGWVGGWGIMNSCGEEKKGEYVKEKAR